MAFPTTAFFLSIPKNLLDLALFKISNEIKEVIKIPCEFFLNPMHDNLCSFTLWTNEILEAEPTNKILYELLLELFTPSYYPVIEYLKQETLNLEALGKGTISIITISVPQLLKMQDSYEQRKMTEAAIYGSGVSRETPPLEEYLKKIKPKTQA